MKQAPAPSLLGQLLPARSPTEVQVSISFALCCGVLSNMVPGWWSLLCFPAVVLPSSVTSADAMLEDPGHGIKCTRAEKNWGVLTTRCLKNIVNISLFTANAGSQVLTERSGCLIGGGWDILLFWTSLEFPGILFCLFFWSEQKKNKTEPGEVSLLVVFSRCLLGLLSLVGEILTRCMGFYFTYVFNLCPQLKWEAGSICSLLWWCCQAGSTGNVMTHCGHDIKHLSFSLFEQNNGLFVLVPLRLI